jgi:SAM-dependent methyltransferase
MIHSWVSKIVQCPDCSTSVTTDLLCRQCGRPLKQPGTNIFNATPSPQRLAEIYGDRLPCWHRAQQQLIRWRKQRPSPDVEKQGASLDMVLMYLDLARRSSSTSLLLDVGCADGRRRTHFPGKQYVGLDAISVDQPLVFPRFTGLAEFLPFHDGVFSAVLCVEVLDHVIDPEKALTEMIRTLTPDGALFLFVGTKYSATDQTAYQKRQARFTSTEDQVHLHQFSSEQLQQTLTPYFQNIQCLDSGGYIACLAQQLR